MAPQADRLTRLDHANALLRTIASCGHHFFAHGTEISHFTFDPHGRIWWNDAGSRKRVYPYGYGWKHFVEGGTLRALVMALRRYIIQGKTLSQAQLGPWCACVCEGDLWGYGEDMAIVRRQAQDLGIIKPCQEAETAD